MDWAKLLAETRIRELDGGPKSGVDDHRTAFQSDFDRVIFSTPVKRLQDKAQVFPLEPNDAVRTRLTHSLEVSCVARGMAQKVGKKLYAEKKLSEEQARHIEDICGTAGLVHDLGNPPFGHYGEDAIKAWFLTDKGKEVLEPLDHSAPLRDDFLKFDGNSRTLRLLCHLQVLSDMYGLNLTAATLAASMKYVVPAHEADRKSGNVAQKKPGYCYAESAFVGLIREATGIGPARHPLVYLVEAADDCVYSICDIEDAVEKGILSFDQVASKLTAAANQLGFDSAIVGSLAQEARTIVRDGGEKDNRRAMQSLDKARMQMFRVKAIGCIVKGACAAFMDNYPQILSGVYETELCDDPVAGDGKTLVCAAKKVGVEDIYSTRPTVELELRGGHIIHGLLDKLWDGVDPEKMKSDSGRRCRSLISQRYRNVNELECAKMKQAPSGFSAEQIQRYYDLLLLADYVSGMTDSYASRLYGSLTHG